MPGKKGVTYMIPKKRKRESRILNTAKMTLSINITEKLLSTCKDSETFVCMMFSRELQTITVTTETSTEALAVNKNSYL